MEAKVREISTNNLVTNDSPKKKKKKLVTMIVARKKLDCLYDFIYLLYFYRDCLSELVLHLVFWVLYKFIIYTNGIEC